MIGGTCIHHHSHQDIIVFNYEHCPSVALVTTFIELMFQTKNAIFQVIPELAGSCFSSEQCKNRTKRYNCANCDFNFAHSKSV